MLTPKETNSIRGVLWPHNTCRLCSSDKNLAWVYDEKFSTLLEMIRVICGVEISKSDPITQMVCGTCCQVTIKMYQFRTKSIKNDKDLKARCAGYNVSQLTNSAPPVSQKSESAPATPASVSIKPVTTSNTTPASISIKPATTPNTTSASISIKPATAPNTTPASISVKPVATSNATPATINVKPVAASNATPATIPPKYKFAHPSIKEVVKKHPDVKLPLNCLKSHVGAYITLLTDEVDEWYKERNYTDSEIAKLKKKAAELAQTAEKEIPSKKRKKIEQKSRPTSPTNSAKRIRLTSESSDKSTRRKLRDKSDSDASSVASVASAASVASVSSVMSVPEKNANTDKSNSNERVGNARNAIKTRSSDVSAKPNLSVQSKTDPSDKSDCTLNTSLPVQYETDPSDKSSSILNNLLVADKTKKINILNEITLKSILASSEKAQEDDEIIEIDDAPSPEPPKDTQPAKKQKKQNDPAPISEADLFTSRPFLKDSTLLKKPEDTRPNNKNTPNIINSDPIIIDGDSRSSSDSSVRFNENDKTSFAEALELAPKSATSNMPDLSLVSLANKSHTLYTCKVCDSQHSSLKDLKIHMRRTHTKCPFCNKRFRTSALRDEHVKNTCSINRSPVKLKKARLHLVRVDEDEEIRKQYPGAFEDLNEENVEVVDAPAAEDSSEKEVTSVEQNGQDGSKGDEAAADAIVDMEKFLSCAEITPIHDPPVDKDAASTSSVQEDVANTSNAQEEAATTSLVQEAATTSMVQEAAITSMAQEAATTSMVEEAATISIMQEISTASMAQEVATTSMVQEASITSMVQETANKTDDVICISDDESEVAKTSEKPKTQPHLEQKINVVNSEILAHINIHDNDVNVLKRILSESRLRTMLKNEHNRSMHQNTKDVWSLMHSPIINGSSSRVKIFKNLRKYLQHYKIPIEVKHSPTLSVEYKQTEAPPVKGYGSLWYHVKPIELKPWHGPPTPQTTTSTTSPVYTILNTQIGANMKPINTSTANINGPVVHSTVMTPIQPKPTVMTPIQPKPTVSTAQNNVVSTANLLLTPSSVVTTTSNTPSASLVLSGTRTVNNTKYANFIIVPNSLLTVPSTQGPLPVIASVSSGVDEISTDQPSVSKVAQLESITNSLMPNSTTNSCDVVVSVPEVVMPTVSSVTSLAPNGGHQPAIRVKDLKELS